ncbi:polysaccharide biosynthesis tyrosine autokinase [Arthrobacter humicola]
MTPTEFLATLRRQWATILVLGIIGAIAGLGLARLTPESFRATSSVFVSAQRGDTSAELVQGSTFTQNIVQSYAELASMPVVLEPVIERLDLDVTPPVLARSISAQTPLNTFIIEITVTDNSPEASAKIANAVSDELATAVQRISPKSANNAPVVTLQNVARAPVPRVRSAPDTPLMVVTGLGIGLALGYGFVLLREVLDTRIRSEKDLERVGETPLLGLISRQPGTRGQDERPVGLLTGATAETYRRLATNIEFLDPDTKIGSLVVTSSMPGEGKTTTAINLALAAGELAPRVLLVDADLRRPSVAKYCGVEGAVGLTSVLSGQVSLDDAVQQWSHINVLTAGTLPPNPSQIVNSNAMADLLVKLSRSFDLVVVDSPPLLPVTDALALSRITDGALVVVRYKVTRRQQLSGSLRALEAVKARAIGVVLNRVNLNNKDSEYVYEGSSEPRQKTLRTLVFRTGSKKSTSAGAHARRKESYDERTPPASSERVSEPSER